MSGRIEINAFDFLSFLAGPPLIPSIQLTIEVHDLCVFWIDDRVYTFELGKLACYVLVLGLLLLVLLE
jgi:hypothetical protein